jgi:hypothetical protein
MFNLIALLCVSRLKGLGPSHIAKTKSRNSVFCHVAVLPAPTPTPRLMPIACKALQGYKVDGCPTGCPEFVAEMGIARPLFLSR